MGKMIDILYSGHAACPGCIDAVSARHVLAALGPDCVAVMPPSCLAVIAGPPPLTPARPPPHPAPPPAEKPTRKKNFTEIMAAHRVPYAATATAGFLRDLVRKVEKAKSLRGTRVLTLLIPCLDGWGVPEDQGI